MTTTTTQGWVIIRGRSLLLSLMLFTLCVRPSLSLYANITGAHRCAQWQTRSTSTLSNTSAPAVPSHRRSTFGQRGDYDSADAD